MIQYREIIRLRQLGINKTDIAKSLGCSRTTVRTVLKHAQALGFSWPLPPEMTDEALQQKFFQTTQEQKGRRYPDVKHIHKELMRDGVNLKLLWSEYCTQCRQANELPLMYSQFCELYRRYAQTQRMTMHIPRKPGEILEVDWAGQTTTIFDRDSGEPITAYLFENQWGRFCLRINGDGSVCGRKSVGFGIISVFAHRNTETMNYFFNS